VPDDSPEVYKAIVDGWIRLFTYVQIIAKEIGEEKAYELLNEMQTQEYTQWFKQNSAKYDLSGPPLVSAYQTIFKHISGRNLSDINITEQSEKRIVHHFDLPCSILDACIELGLDTRKVCKALHQKAGNILLQFFDPRLRFDRDYKKIRPYTDSCVEMFWLEE